jgi:hypothetical protein
MLFILQCIWLPEEIPEMMQQSIWSASSTVLHNQVKVLSDTPIALWNNKKKNVRD